MIAKDMYDYCCVLPLCIGWTETDDRRIRLARQILGSDMDRLLHECLEQFRKRPLLDSQGLNAFAEWLQDLFDGGRSGDYVQRRWRLGLRIVEVEADEAIVISALSKLRCSILQSLRESCDDPASCDSMVKSVNVMFDIELVIIQKAFAVRPSQNLRQLPNIQKAVFSFIHESRNHLQAISSMGELISQTQSPDSIVRNSVREILSAQRSLARLLDDVAGDPDSITLECRTVKVRNIWRAAWARAKKSKETDEAELDEDDVSDTSCSVDPSRLEQVFRNLFDNSLTACRKAPRINVRCYQTTEVGKQSLVISVRDNGPGIPSQHGRRIFDEFYSTGASGKGLGLAISKRIIEAHGGSIKLSENMVGSGAEFTITLPQQPSDQCYPR